MRLINVYKQVESVEIIEYDEPEELTEKELMQLQRAESEFERGETIGLQAFFQQEHL